MEETAQETNIETVDYLLNVRLTDKQNDLVSQEAERLEITVEQLLSSAIAVILSEIESDYKIFSENESTTE